MILEVTSDQLRRLNAEQLVELLRRLVHAELNKNKIPLRSGTAPAQINIADGGEDGRVEWSGAPNQTDFLPSRYTVFQCKRSDIGPSKLKKETQKKTKPKPSEAPELSDALTECLSKSGAYIVVTSDPVVGSNIDRRISAIKEGIRETGNDPSKLTEIRIFDCNILSTWLNTHPSVALWVNSLLRDVGLGGFQTFENWSKEPEISEVDFQTTDEARFTLRGETARRLKKGDPSVSDDNTFSDVASLIDNFFKNGGHGLRVSGPSGFGKTKFVHALFRRDEGFKDFFDGRQVVFAEYEDVKDQIVNITRDVSSSGSRTLIIIDDCPDTVHSRLCKIATAESSNCIVVSTGSELSSQAMADNLAIELQVASDDLINKIVESLPEDIRPQDKSFVRELAQGFPRMAVLAAKAARGGDVELSSVDMLLEKIVWGDGQPNEAALASLQYLSLFTIIGTDNEATSELRFLAEFAGVDYTEMYRHISRFIDRGIINRLGDYVEVQPIPLAMRLANSWLASMPNDALSNLFMASERDLQLRIVGRLRWLSWSDTVTGFAGSFIGKIIPNVETLDSEFGSSILDRFVHLEPDHTMAHLDHLIGSLTVDELQNVRDGRRHIVWALQKLVFRRETFSPAATLLLRLGAAENETWGNNATGQFIGLYTLQLSGTEAEPALKLAVLDSGLLHEDRRVQNICVQALDKMLTTGHFSRTGGSERIGANGALKDWQPKTYGEIFDYYREALNRLEPIALNEESEFSKTALDSISSHLRGLLQIPNLIDDLEGLFDRILARRPNWRGALRALNQWLYFDSTEAEADYRDRLRALFDRLMPTDPRELLLLYSAGWTGDFHDPDTPYDRGGDNDHHYSEREIGSIVEASPADIDFFLPIVDQFLLEEYNNAWATLSKITKHVEKPRELIDHLIGALSKPVEASSVANCARSVIFAAYQVSPEHGRACLDKVLNCAELRKFSIFLLSASELNDELTAKMIEALADKSVEPRQVTHLRFCDAMRDVSDEMFRSLIETLVALGAEGCWSAIELLSGYFYEGDIATESEAETLKLALMQGELFAVDRRNNMESYHWKELAQKLFRYGYVDNETALQLTEFIIGIVHCEEYSVQLHFDGDLRGILRQLIGTHPEIVWRLYQQKAQEADTLIEHRLSGLFGVEFGSPHEAGVLNDMPQQIYEAWMMEDRPNRIGRILEWIKLFDGTEDPNAWSPEFVDFVERCIKEPSELDPLRSRLTTGVWSGSFGNKLQVELERIQALAGLVHNPSVIRWVAKMQVSLRRQIEDERRRDENRDASFRA